MYCLLNSEQKSKSFSVVIKLRTAELYDFYKSDFHECLTKDITKSTENKITNDVHNTNHFAIEDYNGLIGFFKKNGKYSYLKLLLRSLNNFDWVMSFSWPFNQILV